MGQQAELDALTARNNAALDGIETALDERGTPLDFSALTSSVARAEALAESEAPPTVETLPTEETPATKPADEPAPAPTSDVVSTPSTEAVN